MFQEPAAQSVNPLAGFAMGLGQAIGSAVVLFLGILIAAPALASMTLLWAGQRWPSYGNSVIANCIGGVVLTIAIAWLILAVMGLLSGLVDFGSLYSVMPLTGLALVALMIVLQWRARATFSRARLAGISCAVLTPVAWILIYNTQV
jgi:hypothetical protein